MARYYILDAKEQERIGDLLGSFTVACEHFHKHLATSNEPPSALLEAYFRARLQVMFMENMEYEYPNIADSPIFQSVHSDMLEMLGGLSKGIKIA